MHFQVPACVDYRNISACLTGSEGHMKIDPILTARQRHLSIRPVSLPPQSSCDILFAQPRQRPGDIQRLAGRVDRLRHPDMPPPINIIRPADHIPGRTKAHRYNQGIIHNFRFALFVACVGFSFVRLFSCSPSPCLTDRGLGLAFRPYALYIQSAFFVKNRN
jgi:hypothetical protein